MGFRKFILFAVWTLLSLSFCVSPALADYSVGQKMEWRDDFQSYGGGWIPGVITKDYGPNAVERYLFKLDSYGEINARVGALRPTDGSPRMIPKTPAENNFRTADADAEADAIMAKKQKLHSDMQQTMAQPRPTTAPNTVTPAAVATRPAQPSITQPAAVSRSTPNTARALTPPANTVRAALGKGMFPNGTPLGVPGQTNYLPNRQGQKSIVCVAPPGDESFIGRWNLKAGGAWTTVLGSEKDLGNGRTQSTLEYSFPVNADVLVISPGGTWFKQFAGKRTTGNWIDLGQNVVQLIAFDDDDWTGSVKKGQMEIRSPLGMWEYGKRF